MPNTFIASQPSTSSTWIDLIGNTVDQVVRLVRGNRDPVGTDVYDINAQIAADEAARRANNMTMLALLGFGALAVVLITRK